MANTEYRECSCGCGKKVFRKFNSEIWNDPHPNCKLKQSIKNKPQKIKSEAKSLKEPKKRIKWKDKGLSDLINHVQSEFCNPYIRERDIANYGKCITCRSSITQAGHYFPRSTHNGLRFSVQNIHGQEISCNEYKSGNLTIYRQQLILRYGIEYMTELEDMGASCKRNTGSLDRFNVMAIAETFIYLRKNKIWVFRQSKFDEIKLKIIKDNNGKSN